MSLAHNALPFQDVRGLVDHGEAQTLQNLALGILLRPTKPLLGPEFQNDVLDGLTGYRLSRGRVIVPSRSGLLAASVHLTESFDDCPAGGRVASPAYVEACEIAHLEWSHLVSERSQSADIEGDCSSKKLIWKSKTEKHPIDLPRRYSVLYNEPVGLPLALKQNPVAQESETDSSDDGDLSNFPRD